MPTLTGSDAGASECPEELKRQHTRSAPVPRNTVETHSATAANLSPLQVWFTVTNMDDTLR